jgi:hypothetical protein
MKKFFGLILLFVLVAGLATAQTGPGKGKWTLGPALNVELPLGDYADFAGFGLGATARAQYGLQDNLALTGDLGWVWHAKKDELSTSVVPFLLGVKYDIGKNLFVSGQMGFYFVTLSAPDVHIPGLGNVDQSNSETEFAFAPGIGYEHGPWEGLFRFLVFDTDVMNLGLTVAYNFSLMK